MQTLVNVLDKPNKVAASDEAPALGAAIYAVVAAELYLNVIEASKTLGCDFEAEYLPKKEEVKIYAAYNELGAFV